MKYENIVNGIFLNRPNRFLAVVIINNVEHMVHVKNTGRCKEILYPGQKVILQYHNENSKRKTKYSLIGVWKEDMLINIDSQVPNSVVYDAIKDNLIPEILSPTLIKREKTFGNSRFDIYYENANSKGFVEVKGVTLEENSIAKFPDAPTLRGTKHILELIQAKESGYNAFIIFLIQMKGPIGFIPNTIMDHDFSSALLLAKSKGVNIKAFDSIVKEDSIAFGNEIPLL